MADISRRPFLHHLRGRPTVHVEHVSNGRVRHSGTGLSFWFRPLSAALSEVPVADQELPLLFHTRTADFQDLAVQATATYRVVDPPVAAARIDWGIDPETGVWTGNPMAQVAGLLTEIVQQHAVAVLAAVSLTEALVTGMVAVREQVEAALATERRLAETGLAVFSVRVVALRPEPDLEKALQTPARERVQQEADRATYERRANAVERERTISENELQNRIELARREEQLVSQQGLNARRQAEEAAAAQQITAASAAAVAGTRAQADAERSRIVGAAETQVEQERVAALHGADPAAMWTRALRDLAPHLPAVGQLVLTPDLLSALAGRLTAAAPTAGGAHTAAEPDREQP